MKRELRSKSVGTKVSEAELRVLESRAERAGLTLSEWVRDVLPGSSVEMGTLAAERAILAEVLAMRTILLNFMLKVGERRIQATPNDREITSFSMAGVCDVDCDVRVQSGTAKANKFSGCAFSFRAGGLPCLLFAFSGLAAPLRRFPEKLTVHP